MALFWLALSLGIWGVSCDRPPQDSGTSSSAASQNPHTASGSEIPAKPSSSKIQDALEPAFELIRNRQTGPARIRLRKHLDAHPEDAQASFLFGLSYHREQRYMQAMPHFDRAIDLDASFAPTHHFRGWALYYMGDLEEARDSFEIYLTMAPGEPDSLFAIGLIELDQDELESAEEHLKRSIEILQAQGARADRKALSKAMTRLGEVYERTDRLEEAEAQMRRAVELFPDHYESFYKLSRVLRRLGRTEEAQRAYDIYESTRNRIRPGTSFPE